MAKKKSKQKKQRFIAKISKDGKINKKEARKAAKRGISLAQIQRASIRDFRDAQKSYKRKPTERRGSTAPSYSPLLISRGATNVFSPRSQAAAPAPSPAPTRTPTPKPSTVAPTVPEYQPEFDTSGFESQISGLNSQISSLTSGFQNQLGALQTQMQQEREAARLRMEEMQGSFAQALSQRGERPRVEGIRFADRGTGGATQQQLQRRGVRGTFGRAGERLMKISSLNV